MRKKSLGILLLLLFITCTTTVTDTAEYTCHALLKEATKTNDSTIVLYMDLIDSALVQNIRMVEYKAKVSNVYNCMAQLSFITEKYGGYISRDKTKNKVLSIQTRKILEDTSLFITEYSTSSTIMLRIPHFLIDTVLKEINQNLQYIDYRYSKANDSLIALYTAKKFYNNLTTETYDAEKLVKSDSRVSVQYEQFMESYSQSLGAIILTIYQNPETKMERIAIPKLAVEYKIPFLTQSAKELTNGLQIMKSFWYFILRFWPIVTLGLIIALVLWINYLSLNRPLQFKNWHSGPKI